MDFEYLKKSVRWNYFGDGFYFITGLIAISINLVDYDTLVYVG